jgi:Tfp pilus assembly protein PilO
MKFLSKDFTQREKILLVILAILLVLVFYYYAVDMPLRNQEEILNSQKSALETDVQVAEAKVAEYEKMEETLKNLDANASRMESYNNRTNEINFLNDLLAKTSAYSIGFSPVTVEGNQVRREFSLSYTCGSYSEAMDLLKQLSQCKYRCLISDVSCAPVNTNTALNGAVNVSANATFYETLVNKTTEAGLPEAEPEEQTTTAEEDAAALQ